MVHPGVVPAVSFHRYSATDASIAPLVTRQTQLVKQFYTNTQDTAWSMKVLEFKCCKIKALKVLENEGDP